MLYRSGNGSLYISDTQGDTYGYGSESSTVYAYNLIHMSAGEYRIEFDWLSSTSRSNDFGRVYLAPSTMKFSAGNNIFTTDGTTAPKGWLPLDGVLLHNEDSWPHIDNMFTIT